MKITLETGVWYQSEFRKVAMNHTEVNIPVQRPDKIRNVEFEHCECLSWFFYTQQLIICPFFTAFLRYIIVHSILFLLFYSINAFLLLLTLIEFFRFSTPALKTVEHVLFYLINSQKPKIFGLLVKQHVLIFENVMIQCFWAFLLEKQPKRLVSYQKGVNQRISQLTEEMTLLPKLSLMSQ